MANAELYPKTGGSGVVAAYTTPTGDATWTKHIDNATTAAELVMEDAGYIEIELAGTQYRVALYTAT